MGFVPETKKPKFCKEVEKKKEKEYFKQFVIVLVYVCVHQANIRGCSCFALLTFAAVSIVSVSQSNAKSGVRDTLLLVPEIRRHRCCTRCDLYRAAGSIVNV